MKAFSYTLLFIVWSVSICSLTDLHAQEVYCAEAGVSSEQLEELTISFKGRSDKPVARWNWYFGDGGFSEEENPVHKYTEPGEYEVCLKVIINNSCTGAVCKKIQAGKTTEENDCELRTDFKYEISESKLFVSAISLAGNNAKYIWKFGDGSSAEGAQARHEYLSRGEFNVCVTVISPSTSNTGSVCTETICKTIRIGRTENPCKPEADFKFELNGNILSALGRSNAGENVSYNWKISDGSSYSGAEIKHEFSARGEYEICLHVSRPATTANTDCTTIICKKLSLSSDNVSECPLKADFQMIRGEKMLGLQARSNDPDVTYTWTIQGQNVSYSGQNVRVPLPTSGITIICLTVYSRKFGCRTQICKRIRTGRNTGLITPNPATDFAFITSDSEIETYRIFDRINNLILSGTGNSNRIGLDISGLQNGVYFIMLQYKDGSVEMSKIFK